MTKVKIGTFVIPQDEKRIRYAEFANYDRMVEVKAGEYPVYTYFSDIASDYHVKECYVDFGDWTENWYGFQMGEFENFKPVSCCLVCKHTIKDDFFGEREIAELIYQ